MASPDPVLAAADCVAAAAALAGCGSGGDSGDDDKTVDIWISVDQPVLDGLKKVLVPEAKEKGSRSSGQEGQRTSTS